MNLRICLVAVAPLLSVSAAFSAGIGAVYSESQAVPSVALSAGSVLTSPVSVSFGALDLRAPMPLRVWREGEELASDKLNVGMYINGGGRIVPVMATGGESFGGGDSFVAGRISKTSPLPDVPSRFKAVRREIAGNDSEDELVLKFVAGFIMIVR